MMVATRTSFDGTRSSKTHRPELELGSPPRLWMHVRNPCFHFAPLSSETHSGSASVPQHNYCNKRSGFKHGFLGVPLQLNTNAPYGFLGGAGITPQHKYPHTLWFLSTTGFISRCEMDSVTIHSLDNASKPDRAGLCLLAPIRNLCGFRRLTSEAMNACRCQHMGVAQN